MPDPADTLPLSLPLTLGMNVTLIDKEKNPGAFVFTADVFLPKHFLHVAKLH
ncbi:MAG: hypothetical protein MZV64_12265 [Ignavibacteriales bacterium]|nr:hypothetical protein [Ignavibacteriales bacterium]